MGFFNTESTDVSDLTTLITQRPSIGFEFIDFKLCDKEGNVIRQYYTYTDSYLFDFLNDHYWNNGAKNLFYFLKVLEKEITSLGDDPRGLILKSLRDDLSTLDKPRRYTVYLGLY